MGVKDQKDNNFNSEVKATLKSINASLSTLNQTLNKALIQQAYMHKNPDDNGANEYIAEYAPEITEVSEKLNNANLLASDIIKVSNGSMLVDESITKYVIDLEKYSYELR